MVLARRGTSDLTDESQKENSGIRGRRSQAQRGNTRVKKEKETLRSSRSTRVVDEEEDEEGGYEQSQPNGTFVNGHAGGGEEEADTDADAEGEEEEENEVEGSPKGRKRARANTLGDSVLSQSQAEPREERRVTLPRDDDG